PSVEGGAAHPHQSDHDEELIIVLMETAEEELTDDQRRQTEPEIDRAPPEASAQPGSQQAADGGAQRGNQLDVSLHFRLLAMSHLVGPKGDPLHDAPSDNERNGCKRNRQERSSQQRRRKNLPDGTGGAGLDRLFPAF